MDNLSLDAGLISRRTFLLGLLGTATAACAAPVVRTPKEEVARFPLIDVHSHISVAPSRGYTPEHLLTALDAAGIKRMVLLGFGPEVTELARQYPDRFIASYIWLNFRTRQRRGEIKDGTTGEEVERIGAEFEQALKTGLYRGLGEITTIAGPGPGGGPGANISPDSPLVRRLLELAGRYNVPITMHCDDSAAKQMVNAVRAYPKTLVIWAHTGSYLAPSAAQEVLRDHPNVSFDLSAKNPACCRLGRSNYPLMSLGVIDEAWRQLFETYPDRFLVGVDFLLAEHLAAAREAGEFYRAILTQLTPTTARMIGYENAQRVYGLR